MIDQIGASSDQLALANQGVPKNKPVADATPGTDNSFKFFGKDGFTFFDLLDVINPLQHIPVVSTIYRSLTGDEIDPGAKIAGGTLFGGPLGAALSSLDVALEYNTGQDIADHAVAFFSDNVGGNDNRPPATPSPGGVKMVHAQPHPADAVEQAAKNQEASLQPIEAALPPLSLPSPKPAAPKISVPEDRFQAAGMSAIPLAKSTFGGGPRQVAAYQPRSLPDLGMLGDTVKPAAPNDLFVKSKSAKPVGLNDDFNKARADVLAFAQPHRLTPKFSTTASNTSFLNPAATPEAATFQPVTSLDAGGRAEQLGVVNQAITDTKNGWLMDVMLQGLDKYKSAAGLAGAESQQAAVSISR